MSLISYLSRLFLPFYSSFGHHDHTWMTSIAVIPVRYNRFTMYDMWRLHNIYYADGDGELLANNPEEGRLAINTFVYSGSEKFRQCSKLQILPEGCLMCLATPDCAWVKTGSKGSGKCFPRDHALRRYGRGVLETMKHSKQCDDERIYQMHGVDATCKGSRCVPKGDALERRRYLGE